jgi:hypothetical protein
MPINICIKGIFNYLYNILTATNYIMTFISTDLPNISDELETSDFEGRLDYKGITYYVIDQSTLTLDTNEAPEYSIFFESIMKGECADEEINDTDGSTESALELMLQTQNQIA